MRLKEIDFNFFGRIYHIIYDYVAKNKLFGLNIVNRPKHKMGESPEKEK